MIHVLQAYCVISTGVRITCSNQNGQGKRSTVLNTSGSQSMRENIGAIFGSKQVETLASLFSRVEFSLFRAISSCFFFGFVFFVA